MTYQLTLSDVLMWRIIRIVTYVIQRLYLSFEQAAACCASYYRLALKSRFVFYSDGKTTFLLWQDAALRVQLYNSTQLSAPATCSAITIEESSFAYAKYSQRRNYFTTFLETFVGMRADAISDSEPSLAPLPFRFGNY
jgi:hypothetical protein